MNNYFRLAPTFLWLGGGIIAGVLIFSAIRFSLSEGDPQSSIVSVRHSDKSPNLPIGIVDDVGYRKAFEAQMRESSSLDKGRLSSGQRSAIDAWLAVDPITCLNYLGAHGLLAALGENELKDVIHRHLKRDPSAFISRLTDISPWQLCERVSEIAFQVLADYDPKQAFLLSEAAPEFARFQLRLQLAGKWAERNGAEAVRAILADPSYGEGIAVTAIHRWAKNDPVAAFNFVRGMNAESKAGGATVQMQKRILNSLLQRLVSSNPQVAAELVKQLPDGFTKRDLTSGVLASLMAADLEKARQFVSSQDNLLTWRAASWAVDNTAATAPEKAVLLAELLPGEKARSSAYETIATRRLYQDPKAAVQWANNLQEPLIKARAMQSMVTAWMKKNPREMLDFAADELQTGKKSQWQPLVMSEIRRRMDQNPSGDFPWLQNLPSPSRQFIERSLNHFTPTQRQAIQEALLK